VVCCCQETKKRKLTEEKDSCYQRYMSVIVTELFERNLYCTEKRNSFFAEPGYLSELVCHTSQ
jgi:hypothetical protein